MSRALGQSVPLPIAWLIAAFFWLRGTLNWPLSPTYGAGFPGTEQTVAYHDLPARVQARWAPLLEQMHDLRFRPLEFQITETIGAKLQVSALLLDELGSTIAILEWTREKGGVGFIETVPLEFSSYADNDPRIHDWHGSQRRFGTI